MFKVYDPNQKSFPVKPKPAPEKQYNDVDIDFIDLKFQQRENIVSSVVQLQTDLLEQYRRGLLGKKEIKKDVVYYDKLEQKWIIKQE